MAIIVRRGHRPIGADQNTAPRPFSREQHIQAVVRAGRPAPLRLHIDDVIPVIPDGSETKSKSRRRKKDPSTPEEIAEAAKLHRRQLVKMRVLNAESIIPQHHAEFLRMIEAREGKYDPDKNYHSDYYPYPCDMHPLHGFNFRMLDFTRYGRRLVASQLNYPIYLTDLDDIAAWVEARLDDTDRRISKQYDGSITITGLKIEGLDFNLQDDAAVARARELFYLPEYDSNIGYLVRDRFQISNTDLIPRHKDPVEFSECGTSCEDMLDKWHKSMTKQIDEQVKVNRVRRDQLRVSLLETESALGRGLLVQRLLANSVDSFLTDEIRKIAAIPDLTIFRHTAKGIILRTTEIWHDDEPGEPSRYIGIFEVDLRMDAKIRFRNLRAVDVKHAHPHNTSANEVCIGSFFAAINAAYNQLNLHLVALTILEYLRTTTLTDTAGRDTLQRVFPTKRPPDNKVASSEWVNFFSGESTNDDDEDD